MNFLSTYPKVINLTSFMHSFNNIVKSMMNDLIQRTQYIL